MWTGTKVRSRVREYVHEISVRLNGTDRESHRDWPLEAALEGEDGNVCDHRPSMLLANVIEIAA